MSTLLRVTDLTKSFGGILALDGLTLSVAEGEITGLVGPNGAGKTTLFDIVTGYLPPDDGEVVFKNESVTGMSPHRICRLGIGRTFQTPSPIHSLTVKENLLAAKRFGRHENQVGLLPSLVGRRSEREEDDGPGVERALEVFGLSEKQAANPRELQLVERRHLDLARALVTDPDLLLLDEIMAGLNPTEKSALGETLRDLQTTFGVDFLVIEHDLRVIRELSDTVIAINQGRSLESGQPAEVLSDERVKRAYIG